MVITTVTDSVWLEVQMRCPSFFERFGNDTSLQMMKVTTAENAICEFSDGYNAFVKIVGSVALIYVISFIETYNTVSCDKSYIDNGTPLTVGESIIWETGKGVIRGATDNR